VSAYVYSIASDGNIQYLYSQESLCSGADKEDVQMLVMLHQVAYFFCEVSYLIFRLEVQALDKLDIVVSNGPIPDRVLHLELLSADTLLAMTHTGWFKLDSITMELLERSEYLASDLLFNCSTYLHQAQSGVARAVFGSNMTVLTSDATPASSRTVAVAGQISSGLWVARLVYKQDLRSTAAFDFQPVYGIATMPWFGTSLLDLEQWASHCPKVEWISSEVFAFQQDTNVMVRDGIASLEYPGYLLLQAGVGVLMTAEKADLMEASWIDVRLVGNLSQVQRIALKPTGTNESASQVQVAVSWFDEHLLLLFSSEGSSKAFVVNDLSSTLELSVAAQQNWTLKAVPSTTQTRSTRLMPLTLSPSTTTGIPPSTSSPETQPSSVFSSSELPGTAVTSTDEIHKTASESVLTDSQSLSREISLPMTSSTDAAASSSPPQFTASPTRANSTQAPPTSQPEASVTKGDETFTASPTRANFTQAPPTSQPEASVTKGDASLVLAVVGACATLVGMAMLCGCYVFYLRRRQRQEMSAEDMKDSLLIVSDSFLFHLFSLGIDSVCLV
jgi:hypothetical protein